jgi:hypothetical protein
LGYIRHVITDADFQFFIEDPAVTISDDKKITGNSGEIAIKNIFADVPEKHTDLEKKSAVRYMGQPHV